MFDAKSILDILVKGAQPPPSPQMQGSGPGGLGDLAEILGKMMQPGAGPGPGSQRAPQGGMGGGLGGIGDILDQFQKQLGQAGQSPAPQATPPAGPGGTSSGGGGSGGLGDILAELQKQLGQAGQSRSAQPQASGQQAGGNLIDILTQVLAQATSGVKEGAGRVDEMTGASSRAREALGQATGKSPEEVLAQIQEWIRSNPGTAAAGAGGLGAIVLGTQTGRSVVGSAARLGALALIGGLAYKAYQNYQNGRPLISGDEPRQSLAEAAPAGTGFEPNAISNETATLYIRAMIAAAAADGRIDALEQRKIIGGLQQAGVGAEAQAFLRQEVESPASVEELAAAVCSPAEAVQVYTAARLAIDSDTDAEGDFLARLAERLRLDPKLAAHIDATTQAAA